MNVVEVGSIVLLSIGIVVKVVVTVSVVELISAVVLLSTGIDVKVLVGI